MVEEDELGNAFASGFKGSILVADFTNSALGLLREYDPVTDSTTEIVSFVDGTPSAMPSAPELLTLALSWAHSADGRIHFYSAREEPPASKPAAPKKAGVKRVTTAILAEQLNALSAQVALLASEREEQQNMQPVPPLPTRPQPLSILLQGEEIWDQQLLSAKCPLFHRVLPLQPEPPRPKPSSCWAPLQRPGCLPFPWRPQFWQTSPGTP